MRAKEMILQEIKASKEEINNNNTLILELLMATGEIGFDSNRRAVEIMSEHNKALKKMIVKLKNKLQQGLE